MKATSIAPSNIAFIKYWGKKDAKLRLPYNSSFSMNLSDAYTTTTVDFSPEYKSDEIYFKREKMEDKEAQRVIKHLDRLRNLAKMKLFAKVATQNSFPKGAGIASSASGFAALTIAASSALNLKLSQKDLSILARIGSGSACRSIPDGFVEWKKGYDTNTSYAYSLFPENYWDIRDVIVIVSSERKKVSTTKGHENAESSLFFKTRISHITQRISLLKSALQNKDFNTFGELIEKEAIEMHTIMMTQTPPLYYWNNVTMNIIHKVLQWREEDIPIFFTIDAGPNVHLICEGKNEKKVSQKIREITGIERIIVNKPAKGAALTNNHLF
ncbi:diphosphomevalonate decarboxylase [Candidatus Gottesmanbacteria bacterium]|nr:diphosphomevalonate decarboxylase [Candidatus Gottesmanbacteria bacterium]